MSKKQKATSEPWSEVQPYLKNVAGDINAAYDAGQFASSPVPFGGVTRSAMDGIRGIANNNQVTQGAMGNLDQFMKMDPRKAGSKFQRQIQGQDIGNEDGFQYINPNGGFDAVSKAVSAKVLPQVAGMFGQGGFANSTAAQSAAAEGLGNALSFYAYDDYDTQRQMGMDQFNKNRDTRLSQGNLATQIGQNQFNTNQNMKLSAMGMSPVVNQMQYGDQAAKLGVGEKIDARNQQVADLPFTNMNNMASVMGGLGGLGSTQSQSPSALQTASGLGQLGISGLLAYGLLCDRRLKRDIERVGTWRGLAIYTFRYLWDDVLRIGPMAQEVPERARVRLPSGYLAVDLRAL